MHLFSLLASNYNKMLAVDSDHPMIKRLDDSAIICHDVIHAFKWLIEHECDDDVEQIGFVLNFVCNDEYPRFTWFQPDSLVDFDFEDGLLGYKYALVNDSLRSHLNVCPDMAQTADNDASSVCNIRIPLAEDMIRHGIFDYMDVEQNAIEWARIAEQ